MTAASSSRRFVLLVRHGHSSWAKPGQRDHQRPLDDRGRDEAARVGETIRRLGLAVDLVLCSTATRARETLDGLRHGLPASVPERFNDDLYALGIEAYYAALRAAPEATCALVVGHNPMMEELAGNLLASAERDAMADLRDGFGTGAMAVIRFETSFAGIAPGTGHLRDFIRP